MNDVGILPGITVPKRLAQRPLAANGYHTPWFVYLDEAGVPDFRVIGLDKFDQAIRLRQCWICGQRLGKYMAFNAGPASAINRLSAEPPSHLDCATYAARVCPFLSRPNTKRRENNLPPGVCINQQDIDPQSPGLTSVWLIADLKVFTLQECAGVTQGPGEYLIRMPEPDQLYWYHKGRPASRNEILQALAHAHARLFQAVSEYPSAAAKIDAGYRKLLDRLEGSL